jgi:hypothetical protein
MRTRVEQLAIVILASSALIAAAQTNQPPTNSLVQQQMIVPRATLPSVGVPQPTPTDVSAAPAPRDPYAPAPTDISGSPNKPPKFTVAPTAQDLLSSSIRNRATPAGRLLPSPTVAPPPAEPTAAPTNHLTESSLTNWPAPATDWSHPDTPYNYQW